MVRWTKVRGIQVSLLDIREDTNGFIRWNCVTNKFEWFKRSE